MRAAGRLVIIAIIIALAALVVSEWLARRAAMRFTGGMSVLAVDVEKVLGAFTLAARFEARAASPRYSARRAPERPPWST